MCMKYLTDFSVIFYLWQVSRQNDHFYGVITNFIWCVFYAHLTELNFYGGE